MGKPVIAPLPAAARWRLFGSRRRESEVQAEVRRLRAFVELRAQAQENLVRAMLEEAGRRAAEALEPRIQLAASEAMAFAEQGLLVHEGVLRAFGRKLAERDRLHVSPASPDALPAPGVPLAYAVGRDDPEARGCRRLEIADEGAEAFVDALSKLAIPPGGAKRLVASHVLQHAPAAALKEQILQHWRERLAPGGELLVITHDGPAWTAAMAREAQDFPRFADRLAKDEASWPLRSLFDEKGLQTLLRDIGYETPIRVQSYDPLELRMTARAPA